jgi:hypothetical protein
VSKIRAQQALRRPTEGLYDAPCGAPAGPAGDRKRGLALRLPRVWTSVVGVAVAALALGSANAQAVVNPVLSGSVADSATLPGATAVAVAGHYAYATDYYAGRLTAIDISNPSAPVIAGSSQASNELLDSSTVNIAGGYAYVVSKNRNGPLGSESNDDGTGNSLTILDIASNPAEPAIVGSVRDANTLFGAYGVAISGQYAFVASQGCLSGQPCPNHSVGSAFAVIDASNPASPSIVASLHNAALPSPWKGTGALAHATSVAISGSYAYVTAAYQDRLTVISIANPLSPKIVASLRDTTNLNFPVDVAVSGQYAYITDQVSPGRLTAVDVSNPEKPQVVASLSSSGLSGAYRVRLHGYFAYVSASSAADVAAVDISNPLSPRLAATVVSHSRLNKTTGLDLDPSGSHVVTSSPYLSTQSQPLYPPFALQPGGPTLTGTVSALTLDPSPVAVSISSASEPADPTAQTFASFGFSVNDAVSTVQCQLDGGPWLPCATQTSEAYEALGAGSHTFAVQATDAAANTNTASYSWSVVAPASTSPPTISGSASVGQVLSASPGSWTGSPTFAYQWLRCDVNGLGCWPMAGATSSSHTVEAADAGSTIEVQVSATTSAGSASAESSPTAAVTAEPASTSPPAISGNATEGQALSVSPGSWSGYPAPSFEYQWQRCDQNGSNCTAINGANASTYALGAADVSSTIAVVVTASNSTGSAQANSAATAVVTGPPASTSLPAISGNATEGQALSVSPGSWSGYPEPSFEYQWQRCNGSGQGCTPIPGPTSSIYTALSADVGSTLAVAVTASNGVGSMQASSAASAVVLSAAGPLTPILDNFARPNNIGPPGPNWTHMVVSSSGSTNNLFITNQQVTGRSGSNADYWNPQTFGPNSEVWVTVAVKPNIDQDPVVLGLRFQNPGAASASGYQAYYIYRSLQADQYKIISRANGTTSATLATVNGPTLNPGDQLLFRAIGTTLELWRFDAGTWTRILSATDSTYQSAGYLNLSARDGAVRLTNFGGGTLP